MPVMVAGPDRDRLFRLAARQAGHFTAAQAGECGFDRVQVRTHEKAGTFARVHPAVYRFARYPAPSYGEVMAAWLAVGADGAVVSHETALRLHGLSRGTVREVHLTVPRAAKEAGRHPLRAVTLHVARRRWRPGEVVQVEGMAVTAPARAIADAAEAGASAEEVEGAVRAALDGGAITRKDLTDAARGRSEKVARVLRRALSQAAKSAKAEEP